MNHIRDLRKPPLSLVRLIESIGVLLLIPITKKKSNYKITLPSNYDDTITALGSVYDECITKISLLESSNIDNHTAYAFYSRILDPAFIYEDIINIGGLLAKDLFNCCLLILQKLQLDTSRLPVLIHDMIVLVDGSKASMIALDTASHVFKYGTLHIVADNVNNGKSQTMKENLHLLKVDIHRRCKLHYKLADHTFQIHDRFLANQTSGGGGGGETVSGGGTIPVSDWDSGNIVGSLESPVGEEKEGSNQQQLTGLNEELLKMKESLSNLSFLFECRTLVIGLSNPYDFPIVSSDSLAYWSVWNFPGDTIVTKGMSFMRPFTEVSVPRTFLLYLNPDHYTSSSTSSSPSSSINGVEGEEEMKYLFQKSLQYYRSGDNIIILSPFLSSDPTGDNQETRYDFGKRHLWLKSDENLRKEPNCYNWNDKMINNYSQLIYQWIGSSFLIGKLRVERYSKQQNIIQLLTNIALQENVQGIIMAKKKNNEIIKQCIRDYPYSLVLLN
jgi:hypothetical protein